MVEILHVHERKIKKQSTILTLLWKILGWHYACRLYIALWGYQGFISLIIIIRSRGATLCAAVSTPERVYFCEYICVNTVTIYFYLCVFLLINMREYCNCFRRFISIYAWILLLFPAIYFCLSIFMLKYFICVCSYVNAWILLLFPTIYFCLCV